MTDYTIPDLADGATLTGAELLEMWQGSDPSVKTTIDDIVRATLTSYGFVSWPIVILRPTVFGTVVIVSTPNGNSASAAGNALITAGSNVGVGKGGDVVITSGSGNSGADNGNIVLNPGNGLGPGTTGGLVIIGGPGNDLPTADPHIEGALYTVANVVHISAG